MTAINDDIKQDADERGVRHVSEVGIDRLLLDKDNPRLACLNEIDDQFGLARVLWTEMAVDELVMSIAANGFFPEEPLFVIPQSPLDDDTKLVVVEGNRRLAAVLILLNQDWHEKLKITNIPAIGDHERNLLQRLPVSIYKDRKELWEYLGYRYINSAKPWDSFSKAKYVAQIHDEYKIPLPEIARKIGDRYSTVQRLYRSYKVIEESERKEVFKTQDKIHNRFYFRHLYMALDYPEFLELLGIDINNFNSDEPVDEKHLGNLKELLTWLYGSREENKQPVIHKANPDLNTLREVIKMPAALDALRSGYSLEKSHSVSIGDNRRFREALVSAKEELMQANATVITGYNGDVSQFEVIDDIYSIVKSLHSALKQKQSKPSKVRQA